MKAASWELKRMRYLMVFCLFLFIPGMVSGEETPVPNSSIQRKSQLITVIVADYYPYTFVNKEGVPDGFSVDLAKAVAKVMGMDLEIKVDTWERAIRHLETGEIDLLPMMAYSKERDKVFDFSVPHTVAFDAFFIRKDSKRLNTIEDLKGHTVIVMKGDQAHDYLRSSGLVDSEHLILVDSLPEALRLLSSGKGDAALMPKLVGLMVSNDLNLTNLTQSPVVVESYNRPFSFAVKEGNQLLMERLSQGLSIVKNAGQYREIYDKWFGALEPKELTLKSVLKYIVGLLLALLLIGSAFALWSFSLKKQVASRTKKLADEIVERKIAEMRFRQVTETIREVFWLGSLDWKEIHYISPAYEHVWGRKCEELYQSPLSWFDSVVEEDRQKVRAAIPEVISTDAREIVVPDYRIRRPDGSIVWISARAFPVLDTSGRPFRIAGIAEDITTRKRTEDALIESEEKFRLTFDFSPDAVNINRLDDGLYVDINEGFTRTTGFTRKDVIGKTSFEIDIWHNPADREKLVKELREKGFFDNLEARFRRKDAGIITALMSARVISLKDVSHIISISRDITERKLIAAKLQQAQKFEAIGTLAGGVAHDFNNLLMGIQGRASLISLDMKTSHPHLEHIDAIEEYIRSATNLTKQLLGFARGGKYEVKPIDINELVLSSSAMFGRTKKEIQIHTKCQKASLAVEADRGQIEQVLLNMYVNAWQAMPPGGGELYLETRTVMLDEAYCKPHQAEPGHYVKVSITDTGAGMDEATRLQIFDPFFTTKEKSRGTGMGLASAYGIIKNHGGMITVYSEIGHGTTFNIYLPVSDKEVHQEVSMKEGLIKGSATILLVDDEELIIDVGQAMLERLGYRVVASKGGQEAVKAITDMGNEIDLVILDMIMPGMDGGATFDRIREIQLGMPVLLSSGYAINGQAHEIMRRGCNGFIQKPYNISELSNKVRNVLDERKS